MRFLDLKIGDHFFFEGLEYTKTSPVLATGSNGQSRFIPQSAVLQTHPVQRPPTSRMEASELDRLYQAVTGIIRQEVRDVDLEMRLHQAIEKVWRNLKEVKDKYEI